MIDILTKKIKRPSFQDKQFDKTILPYFNFFWMDSKQNLWLSDSEGLLYKYNTLTYKIDLYDELYNYNQGKTQNKKPYPSGFIEDSYGTVWISSYYGGLSYYDEKRNGIQSIAVNNNLPSSLHYDHYINTLTRDYEGNIWVGTDKGINIFNPTFQQFATIDENNVLNPFPKSEVTKIIQTSSGNILVSTWGNGWFMYDKDFRLKKHFHYNSKLHPDYQGKKNLVWSLAEDGNGKIWIGYQHGLIGIYDTINQHIQYIDVPEFNGKTVMAIQCDAKGNMWFGLYSGFLGKWDITKKEFFIYKDLPGFPPEEFAPISNILINKQNEIWVATNGNGFYCFDPIQEKVTERYTNKKPVTTLDGIVNSLTQINDSIIGVSTNSKGFLLFNKEQKTFSSFTINDGLPINSVYGLTQDKQNNLWIATTNGLLRLNQNKHKFLSFDEEDGLLNKRFIANIVSLHNGKLAIPTSTGLVYFSPDNINKLPVPPDAQITSFKVFDQSLPIDSILYGNKTVELNHHQDFITIGYASLSFLGRNSTQYFYQLENVDKGWVKAGQQRFASYTNLSPGNYTFKLKCENRDGIPSKKITILSIYIRPPWWATWWAYTLYSFLIVTAGYTLYRNHIHGLEKKQAAQIRTMVATQEEERKRISRDLHDDIGARLTNINILSALGQQKINEPQETSEYLKRISNEIQTSAEALDDIVWSIDSKNDSIEEVTARMRRYTADVFDRTAIRYTVFVDEKFLPAKLYIGKRRDLFFVFKEAITNIQKHAMATEVNINIEAKDNNLLMQVNDNGKGFDTDQPTHRNGLKNIQQRMLKWGGTCTVQSSPGKGAILKIELPVSNPSLKRGVWAWFKNR